MSLQLVLTSSENPCPHRIHVCTSSASRQEDLESRHPARPPPSPDAAGTYLSAGVLDQISRGEALLRNLNGSKSWNHSGSHLAVNVWATSDV